MEYLITALEITMALFAVIGIYSTARMLSQRLFGSRQLVLAIEIFEEGDVESIESLVLEGLGQFLLTPSGRVLILTTTELAKNEELQRVAGRYDVPIVQMFKE